MKPYLLLRAIMAGLGIVLSTNIVRADGTSGNPATQPTTVPTSEPSTDPREATILGDVLQLTSGFDKAGEAYFSPDMKWIIFQASPHEMPHYQMYVAPLKWDGDRIIGLGVPTRSQPRTFSEHLRLFLARWQYDPLLPPPPAKKTLTVKEGGYQREGRDYRWAFPAGMEIYKAEGWKDQVQAANGKGYQSRATPTDQ